MLVFVTLQRHAVRSVLALQRVQVGDGVAAAGDLVGNHDRVVDQQRFRFRKRGIAGRVVVGSTARPSFTAASVP